MEGMTSGTTAMDTLAERLANGDGATEDDARMMLATPDLIAVGVVADDVRRRRHDNRVTFLRVLEVHLERVPATLPARTSAGEIRIVGTPVSVAAASAAVVSARSLSATTVLTGFSLFDLAALGGTDLAEVCAELKRAGLDGIAEVPVDRLTDAAAAIATARAAGLEVQRLTVDALTPESRVTVLVRARDLQASLGGFQAFAPLPREMSIAAPSTGYDDVKLVAAARVLVSAIPSIQADWARYGPKLAQVTLTMGADDLDGVSATDPNLLGTRRSPIEEIRGNIRAAGLEPVERDGRFAAIG
jgi:aminodeoxyfutalosine synthase